VRRPVGKNPAARNSLARSERLYDVIALYGLRADVNTIGNSTNTLRIARDLAWTEIPAPKWHCQRKAGDRVFHEFHEQIIRQKLIPFIYPGRLNTGEKSLSKRLTSLPPKMLTLLTQSCKLLSRRDGSSF